MSRDQDDADIEAMFNMESRYSPNRGYTETQAEMSKELETLRVKLDPHVVRVIGTVVGNNELYPHITSFQHFLHDAVMHRLRHYLSEWPKAVDANPELREWLDMWVSGANAKMDPERDAMYHGSIERCIQNIRKHQYEGDRKIIEDSVDELRRALYKLSHRTQLKERVVDAILLGKATLDTMTKMSERRHNESLAEQIEQGPYATRTLFPEDFDIDLD